MPAFIKPEARLPQVFREAAGCKVMVLLSQLLPRLFKKGFSLMSQPCMWLTAHKRSHFSRASIKPLSWFWHSLDKTTSKYSWSVFFGNSTKNICLGQHAKVCQMVHKVLASIRTTWKVFLYKICKHPFSKGGLSCPSDITVSFFPHVALVFLRWKEYPCCHSTVRLDTQKPEKNLARSCEDVAYIHTLQSWIISMRFHWTSNRIFLARTLPRH